MILGIDTSAGQCAVALLGDGVFVRAQPMQRGHAEALFPMIEEVLTDAGADMAALRRIGVCTGPGSFTGVRVGVSAARGLALGLGIPAVGISRLAAVAAACEVAGHVTIAVPMRPGTWARQDFHADRTPAEELAQLAQHGGLAYGFVHSGQRPSRFSSTRR